MGDSDTAADADADDDPTDAWQPVLLKEAVEAA